MSPHPCGAPDHKESTESELANTGTGGGGCGSMVVTVCRLALARCLHKEFRASGQFGWVSLVGSMVVMTCRYSNRKPNLANKL